MSETNDLGAAIGAVRDRLAAELVEWQVRRRDTTLAPNQYSAIDEMIAAREATIAAYGEDEAYVAYAAAAQLRAEEKAKRAAQAVTAEQSAVDALRQEVGARLDALEAAAAGLAAAAGAATGTERG